MVEENLRKIKERIRSACTRSNRDPGQITIVAVSKGRPIEQIKEVLACGITDIGENRIQEAVVKYNELAAGQPAITWHMVGHLQTNKVKEAVKIFGLIQSVDSLHLAQEINKQAAKINKLQDILIEVKTSPEAAKSGLKPDEVIEVINKITGLPNIRMQGLMTIAPLAASPEEARPYFRGLKELFDEINARRITPEALRMLSMGMTDDFEIALEEGSNMVRLGRAIFE